MTARRERTMFVAAMSSPRLILAIGFVVYIAYAYPGYMSSDSVVALEQARSHVFSDWHPPAMAALWSVVELFITGPFGMLLVQGSLFLIGIYRILRRDLGARRAAVAAVAILLFPPVLAPMGVIWKDSQMAALFLFGISLLSETRSVPKWIGVALLAVGTAMRANAAAATLPIFLLLYTWRHGMRWWKRLAIGLVMWTATVGAATATNHLLTRVNNHAWHCSVALADLIGVLKTSRTYSDAELLQIFDGTPLVVHEKIFIHARTFYNATTWWPADNGPNRMFDWPTNELQRDAITRAWRTLVLDNPLAYFYHRLRVFREVLGLTYKPVFDPVWTVHMDQTQQPDQSALPSTVQRALVAVVSWFARATPLVRPYIYFYLAFILLPLARRHRDVIALLASGIVYEFTMFPFAPSPDFRYSHWMIVCTVISIVILVRRRARGIHESIEPIALSPDTPVQKSKP